MKTREQVIQDQINDIMDTFDFGKVRKTMQFLGWQWALATTEDGIPEEYELRTEARKLLNHVSHTRPEQEYSFISTGGFHASIHQGTENGNPWLRLELKFCLDATLNDGETYSIAPVNESCCSRLVCRCCNYSRGF